MKNTRTTSQMLEEMNDAINHLNWFIPQFIPPGTKEEEIFKVNMRALERLYYEIGESYNND